ncbi:hypothetical protein SADUNF_Sadunf19G0043400 [Salix dunnii]|uniref:Uncharacterized protein n=1 Tax=Salix dunnii TaxID=1413687 RepID=A0A835IYD2_9ROSI|nr:hypothetical protein SADUNF_Sadunf19G0043200 [Salix dunnii]KAF9661202.1 hypothetical protein SADUNF_Sadunf19G0043400 [Salix dunnii]
MCFDILQSNKVVDEAIGIFHVGEGRSIVWGCGTRWQKYHKKKWSSLGNKPDGLKVNRWIKGYLGWMPKLWKQREDIS